MRRTAIVAAALAAIVLPLGLAGPASAQRPKKPSVSIDNASVADGKLVVKGTYMCDPASGSVDALGLWSQQWNEETSTWIYSETAIEQGVACDGTEHAYETELTSEDGAYVPEEDLEVSAHIMTTGHQFDTTYEFFP